MLRLISSLVIRRLQAGGVRALLLLFVVLLCTVGFLAVWRTGGTAQNAADDAGQAASQGQQLEIGIAEHLADSGAVVQALQQKFELEPLGKSGGFFRFVVRGDLRQLSILRVTLREQGLGSLVRLLPPRLQSSEIAALTRAFRTNLALLIVVALGISALLAFHSAELSLISLRPELKVLRILGADQWILRGTVFFEVGLPAFIGASLGAITSEPLVNLVANKIQAATATLYTGESTLPTLELGERFISGGIAILLSVSIVLFGSWWAIGKNPTADEGEGRHKPARRDLLPIFLFLIGGSGIFLADLLGVVTLAYGSVLVLLAATLASATQVIGGIGRSPALWPRQLVFLIGVAELGQGRANNRLAAGLLAAAVTLVIALGTMIFSFRASLVSWVEETVRADLFVRTTSGGNLFRPSYLPAGVWEAIRQDPAVKTVVAFSAVGAVVQGEVTIVSGSDAERPVSGTLKEGRFDEVLFREGRGIIISTAAEKRLGVGVGSELTVNQQTFLVMATYEDYTSERGIILMWLPVFQRLMAVSEIVSLTATVVPGTDVELVRAQWQKEAVFKNVVLRSNRELRELILSIFDATFVAAKGMMVVIACMCWLGFCSTMIQSVSARRGEFRLLHVVGAPLAVIHAVIRLETTLLAMVALSVGIPAGLGLAWCLVAVVNPLSFGFRFPLVLDQATLVSVVGALGVGVALVLMATGIMIRRFARDETWSVVG